MIVDGAPIPWQQFVEAVQGDVGDASENLGEPGLRNDVAELRGADEAEHEGGALPQCIAIPNDAIATQDVFRIGPIFPR